MSEPESVSGFVFPGTNLLSGGIESVLVQWKYQENQRDFLPRLGAAITHIAVSPDGALFCTSHSDNSKRLPGLNASDSRRYNPVPFHITSPVLVFDWDNTFLTSTSVEVLDEWEKQEHVLSLCLTAQYCKLLH